MGQNLGLVLGLVGAAIGSVIPGVGTAIGYAVGSVVGGLLAPKPTIEGPKLDDRKVVDSAYGNSIPWIRGRYRVAGQCIWAMPELREVATEEEQGKGGGPKVITYSYYFTGAIALCQAPDEGINGIGRIWVNGEVIFDARPGATAVAFANASDNIGNYMRLYKGTRDQGRDPRIEAESPHCSAYRNIAYIVFDELPVKDYGNRVPNIEVEVLCGVDRIPTVDYAVPELLHFIPDDGNAGVIRPLMRGNRTDVLYAMVAPYAGGYTANDTFKLYTLAAGKKPKAFSGMSVNSMASTTEPPTMYGPNIELLVPPFTPYSQRGPTGFTDFTIKGIRGAFGISRYAANNAIDYEVFKMTVSGPGGAIINTTDEEFKLGQFPTLAVVSKDAGTFLIVHTLEHRILRAVPLGVFHEFEETEKVIDFASTGEFFYAATTQGSVLRIHQFNGDGPTGIVLEHPSHGGTFRIHATEDGRVFTLTPSTDTTVAGGLLEVMMWDPSSTADIELVGRVQPSFTVGEGEHLGVAQGKTAHIGVAGAPAGIAQFFWTNGYVCLFDAGVGSGAGESYTLAADLADGVYAAAYRYVRAGPVGPILSGMSPSFAYEIAPASGSASYQYWRIFVTGINGGTYLTIDQFDFYDADDVKLEIPFNNWSSSGSLSDYSYGPQFAFYYPGSGFASSPFGAGPAWVSGWFNEPKEVAYVTLSPFYAIEGGQAIDFEIQGSTDNATWDTVKVISGADVLTSGSQRINF